LARGGATVIKCDVSKEDEVKAMVKKTIDKFGKIDILVNNAGIVFDVPFFEKTVKQWKRTMDVNLLGNFLCSKYVAEQMLKNNSGKIINISSTSGMTSFDPESIDYDSSKAGIVAFTRALAKELAPKIRVNTVAPGWVDTEMNKDLPADFIQEETEKIYLNRIGKPEEIAKSVLFFASEDSNYITGSVLRVDGGHD
jgi:3-oxoacyl-[acyl-carrier protein] reductase